VNHSKHANKNLLDGFSVDAPYITETRRLLQNLYRQQKSGSDRARSYIVTSAGTGEGKSTICSLLAIVTATIFQKRTLLLDGDLRRPSLHSLLGVTRAPGLFDVLRRTATVRDASRMTSIPLLTVIPSGEPRGPLGEYYDDEQFGTFFAEIRSEYDIIFVDSPPAVPTIEPLLMAEHVESILLVAMAGQTQTALFRRLTAILDPVFPKIAGIILNNAVGGLPYYYDYRYYGYGKKEPARIRRYALRGKREQDGQLLARRMGGEG